MSAESIHRFTLLDPLPALAPRPRDCFQRCSESSSCKSARSRPSAYLIESCQFGNRLALPDLTCQLRFAPSLTL